MPELCEQCRSVRRADRDVLEDLLRPASSPSAQAAMNALSGEVDAARRIEDLAFQRRGKAPISRRPLTHDWCVAQSQPKDKIYFFCDWLEKPDCAWFRCRTPQAGCSRCETGSGACAKGLPGQPRPLSGKLSPGNRSTNTSGATPPIAASAEPVVVEASKTEPAAFRLPIGSAFDLWTKARPMEGSLGAGGFQIDYEFHSLDEIPVIAGKGLQQTYLIFGGPGAGKTYYFQYLLAGLLAHEHRPGCLLLDPKGALTDWLRKTLAKLGRADDLTVLEARADRNAFNVLGDDLAPNELGRLLSEVVLAGVTGIDEGWAVLVGDLLEAASIIIKADKGRLTAAELLNDILYRKTFRYPDGKIMPQYPIVIRANRVAKTAQDVSVRIACDRIAEYFASTEPRQRRFVRQIIERTLGELTMPEWAYLSDPGKGSSVYLDIMARHRVVTVAVGQASPAFQRSMLTLVKSIFQQAVLADLTRSGGKGKFFILACDEYAQAVTEGETGLVSDSRFFSLSREAGCLSLLALQSLATGRSRFPAAMQDRWNGILGNVTVKLFMRVNDVETAEMGSKLAGTRHSFVPVQSQQLSAQVLSATDAFTMVEHPYVPGWFLTNRMEQGYAMVHGTLDGASAPTTLFVRVPFHD
jgi:hypothetical protein